MCLYNSMKKLFYRLTLGAAALLTAVTGWAAEPTLTLGGGTGTSDDPYIISKAEHLVELANACNGDKSTTSANLGHYAGKYFVMTQNIDMGDVTDFIGIATAPMGKSSGATWKFKGNFDGQGNTISNLTINGIVVNDAGTALTTGVNGSRNYVGLFGYVEDCVIRNVNLDASCVIKGRQYVGGIAGYMNISTTTTNPVTTIENCHVAATVEGYNTYTGGIVGQASGGSITRIKQIKNCWMSGPVKSDNQYAGGIVGGATNVNIVNCISTGDVSAVKIAYAGATLKQMYVGGISGSLSTNATVDNCFTCGHVEARSDYAGGVAGTITMATATVRNTVTLSPVICHFENYASPTINYGAVTGRLYAGAKVENVYYDRQMWGTRACDQGAIEGIGQLTDYLTSGAALPGLDADFWQFAKGFYPVPAGESEDETKSAAGVYLKFNGTSMATDFGSQASVSTALPGITVALAPDAAPFTLADGVITCGNVQQITKTTATLTLGDYSIEVPLIKLPTLFQGEGTAENPYIIATADDLMNMTVMTNSELAEHYTDAYFKQTADIDMAGKEFPGIACVFNKTSNPYSVYFFSGNYDGGNFTIRNLTVNGARFDKDGKCLSPTVTDGSKNAVGLFGTLGGGARVANIRLVNTTINGYQYVGGIAGYTLDDSRIENCRVEGEIDGYYSCAGGIAGYAAAASKSTLNQITACGFSGSVRAGYNNVGGIIGSSQAVVSGCINTGSVTCRIFNPVVTSTTSQRNVGGIAGYNTGNVIGSANFGPVYGAVGTTGGVAGYNSATSGRGTIRQSMNFGTVETGEVQTAGALIGSESSPANTSATIEDNYYDEQYVAYGANKNAALEGAVPMKTSALTNGQTISGTDGLYTFAAGYYPIPVTFADWAPAKIAAATYMLMPTGSLSNFSRGTLATTMPLTATLEQPEGSTAFRLEGNNVTVNATEMCEATLTINNGAYSRLLPLKAVPAVLPGAGTPEDPYVIASADDFNKIGDYNQNAGQSFEGAYFKVTGDLDFTDKTLTAAGASGLYFKGIIDGQNHKIKNLVLNDAAGQMFGLLAGLGAGGKLSNLTFTGCTINGAFKCGMAAGICEGTIENITVDATCAVTLTKKDVAKNGTYAGGVAGMLMPSGVIINCHNNAPVTALKNVGGICGAADTKLGAVIYGCTNSGAVHSSAPMEYDDSGSKTSPNGYAGGIIGSMSGNMTKCVNTGKVTSEFAHYVGGITGYMSASGSVIDSCDNRGSVEGANRYVAGICGGSYASKEALYSVISDCANYGSITAALNTQSSSVTAGGYAGGIVGTLTAYNKVLNCVNYANISTKGFYVAGIAGQINGAGTLADKCYNVGNISAGAYTGGIVGQGAAGTNIHNCFNLGNIATTQEGYGYAGGIGNISAIATTPATCLNCYNMGNVQSEKGAGGVLGQCRTVTMKRCYNTGVVYVTVSENHNKCGNLLAEITNTATFVDSCYWLSTLQTLPMDSPEKLIDNQLFVLRAATAAELFNGAGLLGNAYVYAPYCFPRLEGIADNDFAKLFAVYYQLADGDTPASVNHSFPLGCLDGVIWIGTGSLSVKTVNDALRAYPNSKGQGILTACCGDYSRSFNFTTTTGIDAADGGVEVVSVAYYRPDGTRVDNPCKGSTVIRIRTMADGTTRTDKVVIR